MADVRIKDITRTVTDPMTSEFVETDHTADGSGKLDLGAFLAARRNALAPRGGVVFDGTAHNRLWVTLTNQNIATDDFSFVETIKVPSSLPAATYGCVFALASASSGNLNIANAINAMWGSASGNNLRIELYAASGSDRRNADISMTPYLGKIIQLIVIRSGVNLFIYINGVQVSYTESTSGTPPANWQGSITSTYLVVGARANAADNSLSATVYSTTLYNVALSAADAQEIYEFGGAVPERYKTGSQALINTAPFVNNGSPTFDFDTFTGATATGFSATMGGVSTNAYAFFNGLASNRVVKLGNLFRLRYDLTLNSGTAPYFGADNCFASTQLTAGVGRELQIACALSAAGAQLAIKTIGTQATDFTLANVAMVQLGAVLHLPLSDGIGYQLHDELSNKLDAIMTTTGVSHRIPRRRGYVRGTLTWAATHEAKSLLGQRAFPDGFVMQLLTLKATAATTGSGCAVGSTTTAARWRAAAALAANTKTVAPLANQLPAGTANNDTDLVVDPDTNNFTGDIAVEAHYALTEGT